MPLLIGWKERIDLPEFGVRRVKAKIDTGARTTAVCVSEYEIVGDIAILRLRLWPKQPNRERVVRAKVLSTVRVRNTSGQSQLRPVIETTLRLGTIEKVVRVTPADRRHMLCPIILGRTALGADFRVDVSRKYLCGKPLPNEGFGSP